VLIGTATIGCSKKEEAPQAVAPALDVVAATMKDVVGYYFSCYYSRKNK